MPSKTPKQVRSEANAKVAKPALKVARKKDEKDAAYLDRYMTALYGRTVKVAKHHASA